MSYRNLGSASPFPPRQQGVVLIVALIMLVAMTLGGIAMMRSMDTSTLIAGNMSFRVGAVQASDGAVEAALSALPGIVNAPDTVIGNKYYPTMRSLDTRGVPTGVDFDSAYSVTVSNYTVNYVIERMCSSNHLPISADDLQTKCVIDPVSASMSSNSIGKQSLSGTKKVYYRVTSRVSGPRNTTAFVQTILGF